LAIPLNINHDAKIVFYLAALGFFGSIINMWGKAVFNGLHRYDIANGVNIFNNFFGILFGVVLINLGYGVVGFFVARVVGFFLSNIAYLVFVLKHIIKVNLFPFFDGEIWLMLKKQVGYGFALRISGMIFSRMDQTLIGAWVAITAVAAYSIPILIATALSGLIASLSHFAFPMASAMIVTHSVKGMESFFIRITKFVVVLSTLSFIPFIVLGDKFLMLWINKEVAIESDKVLIMLLVAFYFNACFSIGLNAFVVGIGQLKYFTFYSVTRSFFLFMGFLVLIRFYGMNGAGVSYIFSLIIDLIFVFYSLRRKLNFSILSLIKLSYLKPWALGFVLGLGLFFIRSEISTWVTLFAAFFGFTISYLLLILIFGVIDAKERSMFLTLIRRNKVSV
jgi:O-antigen/teichoic acid export membrane protein